MPGATPRLPDLYQPYAAATLDDFGVSEFAAESPGALSPFGPEVEFPLPFQRLSYRHPSPAERPHRPGD